MAQTAELAAVISLSRERRSVEWERGDFDPDCAALYVKEIGALGLLTKEEEVSLARDIEKGVDAANRLAESDLGEEGRKKLEATVAEGETARRRFIESNLRLVVSIARRFIDRGLPLDDLIQEGNIGLFRAVEKYDYRKGWRFSTYATWWIRQSISRALIEQARMIRLPVHLSEMVSRVMKFSEGLQQALGRDPTTEELAAAIGVPEERLRLALRALQKPVSLELAVGEDEDGYLSDLIEDKDALAPPDELGRKLIRGEVYDLMDGLSGRERSVVTLRFGLDGDDGLTLDEVGARLGVTRERVRQIEKGALAKLERWGRESGLRDYVAN